MTSLIAALLTCAADEPAFKMPTGAPPTMLVLKVKDKTLISERTVKVTENVPVKETVKIDGKEVERTVMKTVTKDVKQSTTYPIEGTTFQTAGGKKVEPEDALKRLASATLVVVSTDGRPVDEGFLSALKPTTLVVVPPAAAGAVLPRPIRPIIRLPIKD